MEMNINKSSIEDFYKEMFKGSDKNQQLRSLELAFHALLNNKMAILNKELAKLGKHNVFNQNGSIKMEKTKNGGFVFQVTDIKILNKDYPPIYLSGNNILNMMDQLIQNITYLEAFVNIAERSTKKLKPDDRKKVTDKLITEAYEEFPNPSVNIKEVEKDTKAAVTVETTLKNIVEQLPPELKTKVSDLKNEQVVQEILQKVTDDPMVVEQSVKEKVANKVAETFEKIAPQIASEITDPKVRENLEQNLEKAIENTPLAEKVDKNVITKPMSAEYDESKALESDNNLRSVDEVLNTLDLQKANKPKENKEATKEVTERPLNEEEKQELDKKLEKKPVFPNITISPSIKTIDFKEISPEEFAKLDEKEQEEYNKKKAEFDANFVGPRMRP